MFISQENKDVAKEIFNWLQTIHPSQFDDRECYNHEAIRIIAVTLAKTEDIKEVKA